MLLRWCLNLVGAIAALLALLIGLFLLKEALPLFRRIGIAAFFQAPSWHPSEGMFNLVPMLLGTLWTTLGAVCLATPLGIVSGIFCQYYAPGYCAQSYRRLLELLAGIPSVVYGFWGLVVLVPLIHRWHPPGPSLLAGILILTLMILPTTALIADASLSKVPEAYLKGATALGISPWGQIWGVAIPAARSGLLTGGILATGRALGETMAVLMVCGNVVQMPSSLFDPVRTLTANIALEMAYALDDHRAALYVSGLLLMVVVVSLVAIAEIIVGEQNIDG